jgi:hypothetical protein
MTDTETSLELLRVVMQRAANEEGRSYLLLTEEQKMEFHSWIPYAVREEDADKWHREHAVMVVRPEVSR